MIYLCIFFSILSQANSNSPADHPQITMVYNRQDCVANRSDAPGLRVVSRPVLEQSARDSHQGPSREIPGVQAECALVDTSVLRALQTEGSGVPATIGEAHQACL